MSWERMKLQKKIKSWQSPYRLFYLSSIATILTIGGTAFFRLKQKSEKSEKNTNKWFPKLNQQQAKANFRAKVQNLLKNLFSKK